jgi:hypothetical protein
MSFLEELQLAIAAHLSRQEEFVCVPALVIRPRSADEAVMIQTVIENALAGLRQKNGKGGTTAIVQMPVLSNPSPNAPGPEIDVSLQIRVIENPLVNMNRDTGTCLSAETLALAIANSLHHYRPFGDDGVTLDGEEIVPFSQSVNQPSSIENNSAVTLDGGLSDLTLYTEGAFMEPVPGFDGMMVYDVTVKTKTGLQPRN